MTTSSALPSPFGEGILSQIFSSLRLPETNTDHVYDVCVVGSGPAGSVTAAVAAQAGLDVLLVEAGPFLRAQDFSQDEALASVLYQEGMTQRSADGGVTILQGRVVGGSSTVNWTSCFRPPRATLEHWKDVWGLDGFAPEELAPYLSEVEKKLHVVRWDTPNPNNEMVEKGCQKLGWHWDYIERNVKGCWNIGYCGQGCPTNAKQSALTTYLVDALAAGATLWSEAQVVRLVSAGKEVLGAIVEMGGQSLTVEARDFVICGGAVGSPGLLARLEPSLVDKLERARTFLHPVVTSFARFDDSIEAFSGAPQSVYSDQFLWPAPAAAYPGFKIEAMPLLPMFAAGLSVFAGPMHRSWMQGLSHVHAAFAMQRDGFDEKAPGGLLLFDDFKRPSVQYESTRAQREGFREGLLRLCEMQFAAGAKEVLPLHSRATPLSTWQDAKEEIARWTFDSHLLRVGSAHVMGGCPAHPEAENGVVDARGQVHGWSNLFVYDGSIFPTSLGANPQITIFAVALKLSRERYMP